MGLRGFKGLGFFGGAYGALRVYRVYGSESSI